MNIYVGNLTFDMSEEALRTAFVAYGEVTTARIISISSASTLGGTTSTRTHIISGGGLDIIDFYSVDPAVGTMDDFAELIREWRDVPAVRHILFDFYTPVRGADGHRPVVIPPGVTLDDQTRGRFKPKNSRATWQKG